MDVKVFCLSVMVLGLGVMVYLYEVWFFCVFYFIGYIYCVFLDVVLRFFGVDNFCYYWINIYIWK